MKLSTNIKLVAVTAATLLLSAATTTTAQNADNCAASGQDRFQCQVETEMSMGSNITAIAASINCLLDDAIGMNFLTADDCLCQTTLTRGDKTQSCNCGICGGGGLSLDCSVDANDPYITGNCTSLTCSGGCGDGGPGLATGPEGGSDGDGASSTPAPTSGSVSSGWLGSAMLIGSVALIAGSF